MSESYYCAVIMDVWMRGGDPDQVSRTRVEACEANGAPVEEIATHELWLQQARARLARDMARLSVVQR
jgi:hypothetical protein